MVKNAFTMIELIFAIVIIGIVAISLPVIMVNNAKNVESNLMQEAILIVATKTGQVLTYPWDENSRDPLTAILAKTEALNINEVTIEAELDRNISDYRRGHFQQALRRKLTPSSNERDATDNTLLGSDAGDTIIDDLDDFNGQSVVINQLSEEGYKNDYNLSATIVYIDDNANYAAAGGATALTFNFTTADVGRATNIKMIELDVRARDTAGNWPTLPDILFRSFASNIGETDYYKRTY
jgi:prepilin-type N-terminal cleavage/methylation domain-containing protein